MKFLPPRLPLPLLLFSLALPAHAQPQVEAPSQTSTKPANGNGNSNGSVQPNLEAILNAPALPPVIVDEVPVNVPAVVLPPMTLPPVTLPPVVPPAESASPPPPAPTPPQVVPAPTLSDLGRSLASYFTEEELTLLFQYMKETVIASFKDEEVNLPPDLAFKLEILLVRLKKESNFYFDNLINQLEIDLKKNLKEKLKEKLMPPPIKEQTYTPWFKFPWQ
jgi:hypothetical protein